MSRDTFCAPFLQECNTGVIPSSRCFVKCGQVGRLGPDLCWWEVGSAHCVWGGLRWEVLTKEQVSQVPPCALMCPPAARPLAMEWLGCRVGRETRKPNNRLLRNSLVRRTLVGVRELLGTSRWPMPHHPAVSHAGHGACGPASSPSSPGARKEAQSGPRPPFVPASTPRHCHTGLS